MRLSNQTLWLDFKEGWIILWPLTTFIVISTMKGEIESHASGTKLIATGSGRRIFFSLCAQHNATEKIYYLVVLVFWLARKHIIEATVSVPNSVCQFLLSKPTILIFLFIKKGNFFSYLAYLWPEYFELYSFYMSITGCRCNECYLIF